MPADLRWARELFLVVLMVLLVIGIVIAINGHLLQPYQQARLTSFANPNADHTTIGYNTYQARLAIGSGGMFGSGLFHGHQINGGYVFAAHTGFIFATAGEELGFVGGGAVIVLLGALTWRGLRIAARTSDPFGRIVAAAIVCWFAFQTFENIGMNLGIMPVTGIPLPFISYGGSALFADMLAVGLLQNVYIHTSRRRGPTTSQFHGIGATRTLVPIVGAAGVERSNVLSMWTSAVARETAAGAGGSPFAVSGYDGQCFDREEVDRSQCSELWHACDEDERRISPVHTQIETAGTTTSGPTSTAAWAGDTVVGFGLQMGEPCRRRPNSSSQCYAI